MERVSDTGEGGTGGPSTEAHGGVMQSGVQCGTTRPQYQTLMPSSREATGKAPAPGGSPAGCFIHKLVIYFGTD